MRPPLRLPVLLLLGLCTLSLAAEPKRDRYSDPLPDGAIARLGELRLRTEKPIIAAAFTPDGKTLVTANGTSHTFWDTRTGKEIRHVPCAIVGVLLQPRHLSADGKRVVFSRFDKPNLLSFVDTASGKEQRTLDHSQCGFIQALDVSRDGKIMAAVHQASVALWSVADGKLLHELKGPPIAPMAFHSRLIALTPDGKQLVLAHHDGSLHVLDVATGKELRALEMAPSRPGFPSALYPQHLTLSEDGRYVAFCGPGTTATVCELATGKRLRELAAPYGSISGLAFTPNGRFLALADYNRIHLFGVLSGKELCSLPTTQWSKRLIFSPDGRTLAVAGDHAVSLWDMAAQRSLHSPAGHEVPVHALAFFPDGKRLVSTDVGHSKIVWDVASGRSLAQRKETLQAMSLAVEADGETVHYTSYDAAIHRWKPAADREERQPVPTSGGLTTNVLALSPDSRSLAILPSDRQLRLYDLAKDKAILLSGLSRDWALQATFAPDSRRLAACLRNGEIGLWDRDTGKLLRQLKKEGMGGNPMLTFAADGRSLAFFDGMIHVREIVSSGDRVQIAPTPGAFYALAYSPDARFLACAVANTVAIYSAVSGKRLAELQGKQGDVHALAFSPDSRLLASGGSNGTILVWQVPTEETTVLTAEKAADLWPLLGSTDVAAANRVLGALAAAPEQTLPLFKERLQPPGGPANQELLQRRIRELDDESFEVRERAMRELRAAGTDAADLLREALQSGPAPESKRRIDVLLARLEKGDSRRLRFLRGVEVLERIGTPQATELLRHLATKPMPMDLHDEIEASLRRLEKSRRLTAEDAEKRREKTKKAIEDKE